MDRNLNLLVHQINEWIENEGASCSKSFSYDPPLDYFSVWIRISDEDDRYLCKYTAFYDLELNCFDDKITR